MVLRQFFCGFTESSAQTHSARQQEISMGTNFCKLAFDRENRERFCLAKISRYTVTDLGMRLFLTFFDADIVPCGSGSTPELWPSNLCSLTRYITLTLWLLFQIRRGNAWEISCYALMSRRWSTHMEKQSNYCTIIVDSLAWMQYMQYRRTGFNCENLIIVNCELF